MTPPTSAPNYLADYADLYAADPRAAATEWFRNARYGLFLHYGLYSLLGRHEWVQLREKIPVADYAKLAADFTAEAFDADAIAEFAVEAGMQYVNVTTRHHDSFCLFRTRQTDFTSLSAPAGRDLVGELAEACDQRGLGLFCYYSHGRDWRHPHAPNNDRYGGAARPQYDPPEPTYAVGEAHDLGRYVRFMWDQVTELLTQYSPIAGIWLDGIAVPLNGDADAFECQRLYDHVHSLQPHVLVSYKQGLLGTEDFLAPEHEAYVDPGGRPLEVCTTMCPQSWGYRAAAAGTHKSADDVWEELRKAVAGNYNLLLNTGPLADGSLDPEDTTVLRAVGERLRTDGFPN
jgi:alpha-L-fucosidase